MDVFEVFEDCHKAERHIDEALAATERASAQTVARSPAWVTIRKARSLLLDARAELGDAQAQIRNNDDH